MGYLGRSPTPSPIDSSDIPDNSIDASKIVDGSIELAEIADNSITDAKLNSSKLDGIEAGATADQTKADIEGLGIAASSITGALPAISGANLTGINAVVVGTTLPSPVSDEGSLFYKSDTDIFYISNGTQWNLVANANPDTTGGTVTIAAIQGDGTFSYNLGTDFTDDVDTDAQLTYTLTSGTMPTGCTLPTTGNSAFTGSASDVASNTNYTWTIKATDTSGGTATQDYQQTITPIPFGATGGAITNISGYKVHTFTSSGTFTPNGTGTVEYLVIAGGGGGNNGGGGAGGYRTATSFAVAATSYSITVGAGGANLSNGSDSVFSSITSIAGGTGGSFGNPYGNVGSTGGSGGGGGAGESGSAAVSGGSGTSGQGNNGGTAYNYEGRRPGGGGGAGAVGGNGAATYVSGNGGNGLASSITGTSITRAGGAGGSCNVGAGSSGGYGGTGGGGSGRSNPGSGTAGTVNTGSGGGSGNAGGSGIVIIRYAV